MATAAIVLSLRRRRSPPLEAFLAPVDLNDAALVENLASVSTDLISSFSGKSLAYQRKNSRSLLRKIEVFVVVFEYIRDFKPDLPPTAVMCFKELFLLMYRSKILLDYCAQSSKLWLLLQNRSLSGYFHDLNQEFSTLLDVLPLDEIRLSEDLREQIELLQKHCRKAKLYVDKRDEGLRIKFFSLLDDIENGCIPNRKDLEEFFVTNLGIRSASSCRAEIEFLEEQLYNQEGDTEPSISMLNGFVALTRYCRFLLFGFEEEEVEMCIGKHKKPKKGVVSGETGATFFSIPKDFCCPISLDLMQDPVVVSTGQTYDRASISRWLEDGHYSCPKTGQMLTHIRLVPNRALRSLIAQWCISHGIPFDPPEAMDGSGETSSAALPTKAAVGASRATAKLLIEQLASGSGGAKTIAARELRLLAKTGKENRAFIAEAGAIHYLRHLLLSPNPIAQENSVTAMLNLSIYDKNKTRLMDEEGCVGSIIQVLMSGHTMEARENAAATLFSLSAVHDYKKRIADEEGAVEALARLLREGTPRGKKDAVTALFNLSTHAENCARLIEAGAVTALVGALGVQGVGEEAAGALALIVRHPIGAGAVGNEEFAISGLIGMMRCGTPRGKENAVAALFELCRSGGAAAAERVLRDPALAGLLQTLLFTGTKRARRKAASLARVFQRCENGVYGGSSTASRDASYAGEVSIPLSISVPVL